MTTTNTQNINDLITTALRDAIEKAIKTHLDDRLEALDVDVASALVYFNRKYKDMEATIERLNEKLNARITSFERHIDNNAESIKMLQHDKTDRAFEREDIISDMVEACVNEAFKDIDLSDQVRNVLADARIII